MSYRCLGKDTAEKDKLQIEYKAARRLGEVRLGEGHLFYRYFLKISYVAYGEIGQAYMREESGESGEFLLKEFYLMLKTTDGNVHKLRVDRECNVKETLAFLKENYNLIRIGVN